MPNVERPSISVILPVYNTEEHLFDALHSILNQNYNNLEIIIIDDGSDDGTAGIAHEFVQKYDFISCFSQQNRGPSAARNRGISIANGELIAFLDADDYWATGSLDIQLKHMHHNVGCEMVWGKSQFFKTKTNGEFSRIGGPISFPNVGSALFNKNLFHSIGGFDEQLPFSEDLDWFNRARENNTDIVRHNETVLYYRNHDNNLTRDKSFHDLKFMKVLKNSIYRRRNRDGNLNELPIIRESKVPWKKE